jgi:molybdopterin-guanine dinucleotide biosynthesis protein A
LLRAALQAGTRRVDAWAAQFRLAHVPFDAQPVDPFFNANRPEDLQQAEALLRAHPELDQSAASASAAP